MERRGASHTEEEEMNQRRRLLNQARKGDLRAINRLFEMYQVRVYSGDNLKKVGRIPFVPPPAPPRGKVAARKAAVRGKATATHRRKAVRKPARKGVRRKAARKPAQGKARKVFSRRAAHR